MRIGRIYKIVSGETNDCYVGLTFSKLKDRYCCHKSAYKRFKNEGKGDYMSVYGMFDKYGIDKCKIILVKEYEVIDRRHLEVYETLWIKKLKAINKVKDTVLYIKKRSDADYYQKNKEPKIFCKNILERQVREYAENNKEKIKQRSKIYREKNKDKIKAKKAEKTTCECGTEITKMHLNRHIKTATHKKLMEQKK